MMFGNKDSDIFSCEMFSTFGGFSILENDIKQGLERKKKANLDCYMVHEGSKQIFLPLKKDGFQLLILSQLP